MPDLILTNARLIDGTGAQPKENATIVIEGGRITQVTQGDDQIRNSNLEVVNLEGRTLLPGLINAHIHIHMDAGPDQLIA